VTCDRTGQEVRTSRREWREMSSFRKAWYLGLSLIYATYFAGLGMALIFLIVSRLTNPAAQQPMEMQDAARWTLAVSFGVGFLLVFGYQVLRIRSSIARTSGTSPVKLTHRQAYRLLNKQLFGSWVTGLVLVATFVLTQL